MASIHQKKLRSGRFVWELTHGRAPNRIRFTAGDSREEAEAVLVQFNRQLALHGRAPEGTTFSDARGEYVEFLRLHSSESTQRRYGRVLQTFSCFLSQFHAELVLLRDLKPRHLEDYKRRRLAGEIEDDRAADREAHKAQLRAQLEREPRARSPKANAKYGALGGRSFQKKVTKQTINYEIRVLGTFFRWAMKRNLVFSNPTELIERFRVPKRSMPKFWSAEEISAFFAACSEEELRVYSLILLTGMRRGEAEHLTWDDIRLDLGVIFIQAKEGWQPKTDERILPISPTLHQLLVDHYETRRSDRWVIANRAGNRETHLLEKLKKICRRAGIQPAAATIHALRHSFGAHLRMANVPLADIGDLMGHRDQKTTAIYAKVQMEHLREAIGKISPLAPRRAPKLPSEAVDVSLKCVTRADSEEDRGRKSGGEGTYEDEAASWLGRRDSNPDSTVQSRMSYR